MVNRFEQDWYNRTHVRTIKEMYPKVSSVCIKLQTTWFKVKTSEWSMPLDSPLYLSEFCQNPDCTSLFCLTSILEDALRTGKTKSGRICCDGRESGNPGASGCSCYLDYTIDPKMK